MHVLSTGAATDNYPYSFTDSSGRLQGFAVDVLDAIAVQMHLRIRRVPMTAMEDLRRFSAGEFDIGQWHPNFGTGGRNTEYSAPVLVVQGAIFVRKGDRRFTSMADLKREQVLIASPPQGSAFAVAQGIPNSHVLTASSPECLQLLSDGKVDAVLAARLTGLSQTQHLGIVNVETVGPSLEGFTVRYCIAAHEGNSALIAQLNEGLALLFQTGEYDRIYQRWFQRFEPARFTREQFVVSVAGALAISLLVALWALARQRQLRADLSTQASELAASRRILNEAQLFAGLGHWERIFGDPDRATWSEQTYRIFERSPSLGVPSFDELVAMVLPADRSRWQGALEGLHSVGRSFELDITAEPRPGTSKVLHLRGRPLYNEEGKLIGSFGTVQDVTIPRAVEEALRRSEQLLRALYENLPLALGVVERVRGEWRVVSLNPEAVRQFSLPAAPAAGQALNSLGLPAEWVQYWSRLFDRCVASTEPLQTELSREDQPGDFAITLVPLAADPTPARCCFLVDDITERKQKDTEISQSRRLRAIGELVGGIAHEFNNLLTPILLNADLLQAEWAHVPELHGELKLIANAARRSAELTRRLLAFGRKSEQRSEVIALPALVEASTALIRHTFDRRIRIDLAMAPDLPQLFLNAADLNQIFLNLLLNARDTLMDKLARPPQPGWTPCIQISAKVVPADSAVPIPFEDGKHPPPQCWVRVSVIDNGRGMPPAVLERIFEPFYTTKQVGQGTGLGLATTWHLVNSCGGHIEVSSTFGEGSSFDVFLPVRQPPEGKSSSNPPFAAVPAAASESGGLRLLLVEDEEPVANLISTLLKRQGHMLTIATDGLQGWNLVSSAPGDFDAVILDLNMPGLNGIQLLDRARAIGFNKPIAAVSGRVTEEDRAELTRLGVRTIILKPFTVEELQSALASAFSENQG